MKKKLIISIIASAAILVASCGEGNAPKQTSANQIPDDVNVLLQKHTCLVCHKVDTKLIGPAYIEVAKKNYTPEQMVELVHSPKPENWPGYAPMAPLQDVPAEDIIKIANWINTLK